MSSVLLFFAVSKGTCYHIFPSLRAVYHRPESYRASAHLA